MIISTRVDMFYDHNKNVLQTDISSRDLTKQGRCLHIF